jgi:hypothetical protein
MVEGREESDSFYETWRVLAEPIEKAGKICEDYGGMNAEVKRKAICIKCRKAHVGNGCPVRADLKTAAREFHEWALAYQRRVKA